MNRRKFLKIISQATVIIVALKMRLKTNAIDKSPVSKTTRIVPIITDYDPATKMATFDWSEEPSDKDVFQIK